MLAGISEQASRRHPPTLPMPKRSDSNARNFGLIGIAFGVGFALGPVLGGLLGEFGPRVPSLGGVAFPVVHQLHPRLFPVAGDVEPR